MTDVNAPCGVRLSTFQIVNPSPRVSSWRLGALYVKTAVRSVDWNRLRDPGL